MSKEAMKLALEALEYIEHNYMSLPAPAEKAITALREALAEPQEKYIYGTPLLDAMTGKANEALDRMAENAREVGLDYEPAQQQSCYCPNCEALSKELAELKAQQPFGYFKAMPFGWTDCAETDEGAVALYERPPAQRKPLTDEQARFEFEAWHKDAYTQSLERYGHTYKNHHTRCRWQGWLAAHGIKGEA